MLAYLALHAGKAISRERLTGLLWGDRADEQARASLRQALVELRHAANEQSLVHADRSSVTINRDTVTTDIGELEQFADCGEYSELLEALPDPSDQFLANLDDIDPSFDDWLRFERSSQREALAKLAAAAAVRAATSGNHTASRSLGRRAKLFDPQIDMPDPSPPRAPDDVSPVPIPPTARPHLTRRGAVLGFLALAMIVAVAAFLIWGQPRETQISIAVLPFEDRSAQRSPYLADGIAEEIMVQLQRNPGQRVVGRTSAWSLRGEPYDAPTIGRKLNATHLVEGSVQAVDQHVRIDVSLVRARDGSRLWTQRFSGQLGDMLAIQDRIGAEISRRLQVAAVPGTDRAVRGDAYSLYLTAKSLIRERELAKVEAASELLGQALKIEPNFAPAWAALGQARLYLQRGSMPDAAFNPRAPDDVIRDIRRALELQPDLAEAHLVMGMAVGPSADRRRHLLRAAQLNPNDAEIWNALALDYRFHGEYGRELEAWRRAVAIDPLWFRAFFNASETAWNFQLSGEANRYSAKAAADASPQPFTALMVQSDQAMRRADFSSSLIAANRAKGAAPEGRRRYAELAQSRALRAMGDLGRAASGWPFYPVDAVMLAMWRNEAPSADHVRGTISNPSAIRSDEARITFYLATLINAGRVQEAVQLFEARYGSPAGLASQQPFGHAAFVRHATLGSIAYARSGRPVEANQLIRLTTGAAREVGGRGPQPNWYPALCAQLWAVSGNHEAALAALERAERKGWVYGRERDSFADLSYEPAFASIVTEPRFLAIRNRFLRHAQKERSEAARGA